jgi:hypothetical protein
MKGYDYCGFYMGLVGGRYIPFPTEDEYFSYMREKGGEEEDAEETDYDDR